MNYLFTSIILAKKILRFKFLLIVVIVFTSIGCGLNDSDFSILPDVNNSTEVCFTVKDANSNLPIQGAIVELNQYNYPNCTNCPYSSKSASSNSNGKACLSLTAGWWCESSKVTANGYAQKTFSGKPPSTISLTPIGN